VQVVAGEMGAVARRKTGRPKIVFSTRLPPVRRPPSPASRKRAQAGDLRCRRSGARLRLRRASALRRATFGFPARLTFSGRPCVPEAAMNDRPFKEKPAPSCYIPSEG